MIGILEKPRSVTNIWVCKIDPCIHPLKKRKIGIKNLDLWAKNSP
jgi:hypothetical protein